MKYLIKRSSGNPVDFAKEEILTMIYTDSRTSYVDGRRIKLSDVKNMWWFKEWEKNYFNIREDEYGIHADIIEYNKKHYTIEIDSLEELNNLISTLSESISIQPSFYKEIPYIIYIEDEYYDW